MKRILLLLMLVASVSTFAGETKYKVSTGDLSLDKVLISLNFQAKGEISNFSTNLSISYGVPVEKVTNYIVVEKIEPADLYMIFEISRIKKIPVEEVYAVYRKNDGKGWGVIAKKLGIKPGSKEYKLLRLNGEKEKDKSKKHNKNKK